MKYIPANVSRVAYRGALILRKQSPNILFGAGVAGVVTSTVMACRATLKFAEELPKMKEDLETIREASKDLPEDEQKKAIAKVYGVNSYKVVTLYGPSVVVGTVSIAAITGSHVILTRRNAALTAAYAALAKAYDDYRERVRLQHGEVKDLEHHHNLENKGTNKDPKYHIVEEGTLSPYACIFDEKSTSFQKNASLNETFIRAQEEYCNYELVHKGHLFLNEVYDLLGLPRTNEGAIVGWLYKSENGDGYVDFKCIDAWLIEAGEPRILLDFNVDGVIFGKL